MHALEGRLSEGALANLVQFLALNQASGCLQLQHGVGRDADGARGAVYLRAGRVEHVEAEGLEGVAALSALLAWSQGRFAFAVGVFAPRRSIDLSVDALLLHASVARDGAGSRNGTTSTAPGAAARAPHHAGTNGSATGLLRPVLPPAVAGRDHAERGSAGDRVDAVPTAPSGGRRSGELLAGVLAPQSPSHPSPSPRVSLEASLRPLPLQATPLVDPTLIPGLVWAAVAVVGPIGEIFVQEAFESIGHSPRLLPESALGPLVLEVAGRFRSDEGRAQFVARAEAVLAHHGYGRVEESP